MRTSIFITLISVSVAVTGMFPGTYAMAGQIPLTDSCQVVTLTGASTNFSIHIVPEGGEWPYLDGQIVPNTYRWRYQLVDPSNTFGSNSSIAFLVPYCSDPSIGIVVNDSLTQMNLLLPPGVPTSDVAGKTYFGIWTDHDQVAKLNFNANVGQFALNTIEKNGIRQTSIQLKAGNNFYFCRGIKGPDCVTDVDPLNPVTTQQRLVIEGATFNVVRHPRSGHILDVQVCGDREFSLQYCGNADQECCSLPQISDINGEILQNCTSLDGNQGQPNCVISLSGSPHKTLFGYSNGVPQYYDKCCSNETKVFDSAGKFIDCRITATGQIHPNDGHICK